MSGNHTTLERLKSRQGKVVDIKETPKGFFRNSWNLTNKEVR